MLTMDFASVPTSFGKKLAARKAWIRWANRGLITFGNWRKQKSTHLSQVKGKEASRTLKIPLDT
jgi:hypothetical protein